jgi:hypothetical protein
LVTGASQSSEIPDLFYDNLLRNFVFIFNLFFCGTRALLKYLGVEEWQPELLNLEKFQSLSTQNAFEASFFLYFLFFRIDNKRSSMSNGSRPFSRKSP